MRQFLLFVQQPIVLTAPVSVLTGPPIASELFSEEPGILANPAFADVRIFFHHPVGQHRHQCLRHHVRRNHGERNGQGKWQKQRTGNARHGESGGKNGQNTEQDQQFGERDFLTGIPDRQRFGFPHVHVLVNILDGHRAFIHQNPNRQGQPAQGHDVDGLAK